MASRYDNRKIGRNSSERYSRQFKKRGVDFIRQFKTANVTYPSANERASLNSATVVWGVGSRFYKLANEYYGDPTYWWLIAWYNQTPTEAHVQVGSVVEIPLPFESVMSLYMRRSS